MMTERSVLVLATFLTCNVLTAHIGHVHALSDPTREAGGAGSALVEAVLAQVHDACVYSEDAMLLRRLAYVETRDGSDPATYTTPGYDGGIWKVDQNMFQRTKTEQSRLFNQYGLMRSKLGIVWSKVTWADLRRPLYSALAAAMILTLEGAPSNVPGSVDAQAAYWLTHYRKGQITKTAQDFIGPANELQKTCARTENMDLVFLADTSSSVGPSQWAAVVKFISDIIISLSLHNGLGQDKDRVAMATYSDKATLAFGLDRGTDLRATLAQVANAPVLPGGSNTTAAFSLAYDKVLRAARPDAIKVVVLVTDGQDSDQVSMVTSLVPLQLSKVTIFTVGVGGRVGGGQLQPIASAPTCTHAYHVTSHQQLADLKVAVERITCRVPLVLSPGTYTYPCGFNVLAQVQGSSVGISISVSTDNGHVNVWGSHSSQLPSATLHDLNRTATPASPSVIFSRDPRPLTLHLESETFAGVLCGDNFTVRVDTQAAKRTDCNRKKPDLVFLLDSTLATTDADWAAMLNFVQDFSGQFDVSGAGAHVALVSFADTQTTHLSLGQVGSTADLLQAVRSVPRPSGGQVSRLPEALTYVSSQVLTSSSGSRRDASKTLILVTSGRPSDAAKAMGPASSLHALGTRIIVVGVGSSFDDASLNALASGQQHVQKVPDVTTLTSVVADVTKEACGEVDVLCVEAGIQRDCHIEDLVNQKYGNLLGPDRTVSTNPCAIQAGLSSGGVQLNRFPHPSQADRFLLCDSSGQAYVVLCPVGELYNPLAHECRNPTALTQPAAASHPTQPAVTTPAHTPAVPRTTPRATQPSSTPLTNGGGGTTLNPCTPEVVIKQQFYQPYPPDRSKYYHCSNVPYSGQLEGCPVGKVWYQGITQCVYPGVIVDPLTNRVDPGLPNPCVGGIDFFPSPTDPASFIHCSQSHEAYLQHCRPGQVWKQALKACDFP